MPALILLRRHMLLPVRDELTEAAYIKWDTDMRLVATLGERLSRRAGLVGEDGADFLHGPSREVQTGHCASCGWPASEDSR